jgi:hypothetical protein
VSTSETGASSMPARTSIFCNVAEYVTDGAAAVFAIGHALLLKLGSAHVRVSSSSVVAG